MRLLRAASAEARVDAPGAIRRVLFPRFGADGFVGVGPLRAVHLLSLESGATLPACRVANLSVLRLCWVPGRATGWLLRQDCGAGSELPAWTAPAAVDGVEFWVQSRRSNGPVQRHEVSDQALCAVLAEPGAPGWDAPVRIDGRGIDGSPAQSFWWQLLWGSVEIGGHRLTDGDGCTPDPAGLPAVPGTAAMVCLGGG